MRRGQPKAICPWLIHQPRLSHINKDRTRQPRSWRRRGFAVSTARAAEGPAEQELLQLHKVHLVINIATSYGSLAEFENYGVILAERLLVFLNEAVRGGFNDRGVRKMFRTAGGTDEFFDDEDLKSCVLVVAADDSVREKQDLEMYLDAQQQGPKKNRC